METKDRLKLMYWNKNLLTILYDDVVETYLLMQFIDGTPFFRFVSKERKA